MKSIVHKAVLSTCAILVFALLLGTQASAAEKPFYKGKTLKLIVDYSAGGPTDIECRIYARHLKKHLKGNPTIVIQNRAGGGGNLAMNWIYERARRNGTVMGCFTASGRYQEWFVGDPKKAGLRANMEKMIPIMFTPVVSVSVVRKSLVKGGFEDLKKAKQFVAGGFRADSSKDLKFRAVFDLAGVPYKYVNGYQGSADFIGPFLRKEIDTVDGSTPFYFTRAKPVLVDKGQGVPAWYASESEVPGIGPGLPASQFIKKVSGKEPSGLRWQLYGVLSSYRQILAPPETPKAAVEAVRQAFASLKKDPEFLADYKSVVAIEPPMMTDPKDIENAMTPWKTATEELKQFRAQYVEEGRKLSAGK